MTVRTDMKHLMPKTYEFHGIYRGVVEDNNDPDKLGRCRIRVWGVHDEDKSENRAEGIPTVRLPWGEPCLGLIEGSVSGAGMFSVPLQGSHVFCFFEGGNWEALRYFATAPGQPVDAPNPDVGFNDPDGNYPRTDRLDESDYHRLARGETEGTIVETKNENLDLGVPIAGGGTWDEPESAYNAQYPKNIVLTTHRGITVEIDNTEGAERVHVFHPSNSYIEIDVDGNVVFRNEGDRFEITKGDRNTHVFSDDNETIDVDKTTNIGKDETTNIGGSRSTTVSGSDSKNVSANWTVSVGGSITLEAGGNVTIKGARIDLNP